MLLTNFTNMGIVSVDRGICAGPLDDFGGNGGKGGSVTFTKPVTPSGCGGNVVTGGMGGSRCVASATESAIYCNNDSNGQSGSIK